MQRDAAADRLRTAIASMGLTPSDSSEEQVLTDRLLDYVELMAKWNRAYNLTAIREPSAMLVQHVFDSAAIADPLRERIVSRARERQASRPKLVDVGSGAGLPGIVLAALWPDVDVVLVEPVAKKAAFLRQAAGALALDNVTVAESRVEDLALQDPDETPDAIVCRAFASLSDYIRAIDSLAAPRTIVAAMKAALRDDESRLTVRGWRIADVIPLQVPELDAQRSLVLLERESVHENDPAT